MHDALGASEGTYCASRSIPRRGFRNADTILTITRTERLGSVRGAANLEWVERKNLVVPNLMQTDEGGGVTEEHARP